MCCNCQVDVTRHHYLMPRMVNAAKPQIDPGRLGELQKENECDCRSELCDEHSGEKTLGRRFSGQFHPSKRAGDSVNDEWHDEDDCGDGGHCEELRHCSHPRSLSGRPRQSNVQRITCAPIPYPAKQRRASARRVDAPVGRRPSRSHSAKSRMKLTQTPNRQNLAPFRHGRRLTPKHDSLGEIL